MSAEETSIAAFKQAAGRRIPGENLIFHSDRGVQYAYGEFTEKLNKHRITQKHEPEGKLLG